MLPDNLGHEEIKKLLVENQRLLLENNKLLLKMRRNAAVSSVFRFIWFIILIGVPVFVYFHYIQPNLDTIKVKFHNLEQMTADTNFFKDVYQSIQSKDTVSDTTIDSTKQKVEITP